MKKKITPEEFHELVCKEYTVGNITVMGIDGVQVYKLKDFLKQPIEGMLYDLNRGEEVISCYKDDPKWVNDYACTKVIRELKKQLEEKTK